MDTRLTGLSRNLLSGLSVVLVIFVTTVALSYVHQAYPAVPGMAYLLAVTVIAAAGGTAPALLASIAAFFAWQFFLSPPLLTFSFAKLSPEENISLAIFLAASIVVGEIMGKIKLRETEALARERDSSALSTAIRLVTIATDTRQVLQAMVEQVLSTTCARGSALVTGIAEDAPFEPAAAAGEISHLLSGEGRFIAQWAVRKSTAVGLCEQPAHLEKRDEDWPERASSERLLKIATTRNDVFLPLQAAGHTLGLLYAEPREGYCFSISDYRILVAFAGIGGAFLERQRLIADAARADSQREAEKLKSLLLSSISHNLKTPLASLATTVNTFCRKDVRWDAETLQEQFSSMVEDIERLTVNIDNLLSLAQLESGTWKPKRELIEIREVISMALRRLKEKSYERLRIDVPESLPLAHVDCVQMSQVVHHLLENALEYSTPGTPVLVDARASGGRLTFTVTNQGAGIAEDERERIFQRFYRGRTAIERSVRGTGLGLSICREIVNAHGGLIDVENIPEGGARFRVSLPGEQPGIAPCAAREIPPLASQDIAECAAQGIVRSTEQDISERAAQGIVRSTEQEGGAR